METEKNTTTGSTATGATGAAVDNSTAGSTATTAAATDNPTAGSAATTAAATGSTDTTTAGSAAAKKMYDETYVKNLKEQNEAELKKAVEEALKLATMSSEQKAQYEADKKAQSISEREKQLARRELAADTKTLLTESSLPVHLADLVMGEDIESTKNNIAALKSVLDAQVQAAVSERLKGKTPLTGTGVSGEDELSSLAAEIDKFL